MDLSKILSGSSNGGSNNIDEDLDENKVSEGAKEGQWRDRLYKRKGVNFTTNTKETRTLRSLQVHERRKSSRQSKQIAVRGIVGDFEDLDENDENIDIENNTNKSKIKEKVGSKKVEPLEEPPRSKVRREKLAEYLEQKKLEDQKRKMAKPAFKAGLLHHPLAPIGAGFHKPNIFSTNLIHSKSMTPYTSKVAPKIPVEKVKPVKKVATTAAVTGRVTESKAAGKKKDDRITNQPIKKQKTAVLASRTSKTTSFAPNNFEFRPKLRLQPVEEYPAAVIRELATSDTVSQNCQDELSYGELVDGHKGAESSKIMLTDDGPNEKKEVANGNTEKPNVEELVPIVAERITRRRSRRISGVQPDPTLTQEELCVTPARRAKERSVSRDRRFSQCQICPGDRTCATPRITRKSTLPAVDESDTKDYVDMDDKPVVTRSSRRTRREAKLFQLVVENIESTEESRSDLQNNDCMENIPDKLNDLVGIAIEVPLPITEKKSKSSRRLNSQPIEEKVEFDSPTTNLSDSMDKASIDSTQKGLPTFKTPLKTALVAGIKSASKIAISPLIAEAPWVSTSRGSASSKRKRKMNSCNNSVSAIFENLEGSPLLANLELKAMSNENISEADFEEIPAAKQMKLDADFEVIAIEDSDSSNKFNNDGNLEEPNTAYFRNLLMSETARITSMCEKWEDKLKENLEKIPEESQGEIRSVIGQGRLVMKERFTQFRRLVDNCEFQKGEKETTCTDLMGFWEIIYFQVEDVDKKFKSLTDVEANNWIEMVVQPVLTKKKIKTKTAVIAVGPKKVASSGLKALIAAKRKAAEEAKSASKSETKVKDIEDRQTLEIEKDESQVQANITEEPIGNKRLNIKEMIARKREQLAKGKAEKLAAENLVPIEKPLRQFHVVKTFDGGFFSVKSPVRSTPSPKENSAEQKRKSIVSDKDKLRKSVLMENARSGLVSPFVSQVARRSLEGADPSILRQIDKRNQEERLQESSKSSVESASSTSLIFDPIAPLSSPITKTYGKIGGIPAAKQRQIDTIDEMMLGKGSKMEPAVVSDSDVQLISFSPTDSSVPFEPEVPNSEENKILDTPVTKSQIIVKTPARRSTRGKTPKKV